MTTKTFCQQCRQYTSDENIEVKISINGKFYYTCECSECFSPRTKFLRKSIIATFQPEFIEKIKQKNIKLWVKNFKLKIQVNHTIRAFLLLTYPIYCLQFTLFLVKIFFFRITLTQSHGYTLRYHVKLMFNLTFLCIFAHVFQHAQIIFNIIISSHVFCTKSLYIFFFD